MCVCVRVNCPTCKNRSTYTKKLAFKCTARYKYTEYNDKTEAHLLPLQIRL